MTQISKVIEDPMPAAFTMMQGMNEGSYLGHAEQQPESPIAGSHLNSKVMQQRHQANAHCYDEECDCRAATAQGGRIALGVRNNPRVRMPAERHDA